MQQIEKKKRGIHAGDKISRVAPLMTSDIVPAIGAQQGGKNTNAAAF